MTKVAKVSIDDAKSHVSHLVDRALQGDEVVITRHGRPVARLVPAVRVGGERQLGALRGKIGITADFDAALPG